MKKIFINREGEKVVSVEEREDSSSAEIDAELEGWRCTAHASAHSGL